MATKTTIAIDVNLTAGQAADELDKISQAGDEASKSISKLQAEALKAEKALAGVGANERAEAITKTSEALVGGFQAATGAMALFGEESEEVQKAMMKAQSAFLIADGIKKVTEGIGKMRVAFDALKVALLSNPLLGLAAAIVAITTAVYAWLTAESDLAEQIKKSKEEEAKRLELTEKHYDREIMKARALGKEVTSLERQKMLAQLESAKQQLKLDKELERSNLKQAQSRIYLMSLTNETFKKTYDTITKALDNFDAYSKVAFEEQNETITDLEAKLSADRLKMIADTNTAMVKNTEDRYKKEKALAEKARKDEVKLDEDFVAMKRDALAPLQEMQEKEEEALAERHEKRLEQLQKNAEAELEIQRQKEEQRIKNEEMFAEREAQFRIDTASQSLQLISDIAALYASKGEKQAKRAFEIQKAVSIAQTLIETYKSAQSAYASQFVPVPDPSSPVRGAIAASLAIASGLVRVAAIRKQQFNAPSMGGGTSSGGGSIPNMDVSGGSQPTFGSTELNRQAIESGKSITIENNISETEITKKQQRVGVIQSRATID
jgi:hypothetical protein